MRKGLAMLVSLVNQEAIASVRDRGMSNVRPDPGLGDPGLADPGLAMR